ncbi:TetR family transcriptional regulator [Pseudarthrobacter psychrotolerans]|uniref:TetR family transcriptional regulator n=1 Tax=Pseudarthrobacter psychrotolerans TaxID=2697569 RepID=A0A6P1NUG8_9MICC|nr:TetR/AcrR family transcriptional regulator [Pseudarthrobacter psychrotolerans]QHK20471.1 TetR family transcriptional regulator [Pseudarthrobacter psychrotolerans]
MTSQRTTTVGDEKILAATRDSVIRHGVRRTTANDIVERAGISRMTFYRRMGSVENAVLQTLTREFRAYAAAAEAASSTGNGREKLVQFAVESVRVFATSELLASIGERDPEFLIPYVTDRFGQSQQLILTRLEALIAAGLEDGSIEAAPATATSILLALQGVALSSKVLLRMGTFDDSVAELKKMLERYLTPSSNGGESNTGSGRTSP